MTTFAAFGARLQATGILSDPWLEGHARFRQAPVVLDAARYRELAAAGAAITHVHDELARIVADAPELADTFFGLTPWQRGMWQCSAPHWHGIARADVFWTAAGPKVCELNSDTPSGAAEAVLGNRLADAGGPGRLDVNATLPARFVAMVETSARSCGHHGALAVGMLYPTEITEDLSMIAIYRRWLEARGHTVVLGSPFNLGRAPDGRATLFDTPCDVIVRHYKTDWFGERLPVADDDDEPATCEPLRAPLLALLAANVEHRTAVVNPFGAVLTQNKRALAFCHEEIARFSPAAQAAIRRYLPRTLRLEYVRDDLWQAKQDWVLKSDYGCEGAEVVVGALVSQEAWQDALAHAIVRRWVAQEYFAALPDAHGDLVNHGIYVIGGAPAGVLARCHRDGQATSTSSPCAPVFVQAGATP